MLYNKENNGIVTIATSMIAKYDFVVILIFIP